MSKTFRVQSGKNTLMSPWPLMRSSQSWQRFAFICAWLSRFKRKPNQNFLSKGWSSVQRIWKGHRCCQSLLSWLDGLWFVFFAFVNNSQACCLAEFERSPKMTWFDFISSFGGFWLYIFLLKRINQSQRMQVMSRVSRAFLQSWKSSCQLYFCPYIPHLLAWSSILMKRLDFRPSFFSKRRRRLKDSRDQGFAKRCLKRWKCWKH